jgi:hypothetical protein
MRKPKYPGKSVLFMTIQSAILTNLFKYKLVKNKITLLTEMLDYSNWLEANFGKIKIENSREKNWSKISKSLVGDKFQGIEFGVAWGYLTWWWFKNCSSLIGSWHGFDRFTGLPRAWRNFAKGTFDTGGAVPNITDNRITWYVGDIESKVVELKIDTTRSYPLIVFFDLDIFEPSLFAWEKIKSSLRSGDILYFDEAFDTDERKLLNENVLPSGDFDFVSASWLSLAIKVKQIH